MATKTIFASEDQAKTKEQFLVFGLQAIEKYLKEEPPKLVIHGDVVSELLAEAEKRFGPTEFPK